MKLKNIIIATIVLCVSISFASGTWYDVDSFIYEGVGEQHLVTPDEKIYTEVTWCDNSSITAGLVDIGADSHPAIFNMSGTWYMISGEHTGSWNGYNWTGSTWQTDSNIVTGLLTDCAVDATAEVFYKDTIWYLIHGNSSGLFTGYNWSGSIWQNDSNIVTGLPDVGISSSPSVFNMSGVWYLISGRGVGWWHGYDWAGNTWQTNSTIVTGLSNTGGFNNFDVYKKNNNWYLISSRWLHTDYYSYYWNTNTNTWVTDYSVGQMIDEGISPEIFNMNDMYYCICGGTDGLYYGYANDQNFSSYTNYTMGALESNTTISITNFDINKLIFFNFSVDSGIIDYTNITNVTVGEYYVLKKDEVIIETKKASTNTIKFVSNLNSNEYTIERYNFSGVNGIHGTIYEGLIGNANVLPDAIIYIFNTTWSDSTVSDIDGYYNFINLTNGTYTLNFKKDRYDEVLYQYVTVSGSMIEKDVYMQKSSGSYYSRHYCAFTIKNLFNVRYSDVKSVVYNEDNIDAAGTTGFDGSVVFHLFEDVEYRITFINTTQGIDKEITLFPRDNEYTIYISEFSFNPDRDVMHDNVRWWYLKNEINLTHSWLNFSYRNDDNKTSYIEYWINDTNDTILLYDSQPYPCSAGVCGINHIVNASNHTYIVHFSATHPDYPSLANSNIKTISFFTDKLINLFFSEQWHYTVVSICILMFIGLLFGATNAAKGGLIIVLSAWFFSFIQWLPSSLIGYSALVLATILSVGWCMRKSEVVHT